jgi:hypothetical protein
VLAGFTATIASLLMICSRKDPTAFSVYIIFFLFLSILAHNFAFLTIHPRPKEYL